MQEDWSLSRVWDLLQWRVTTAWVRNRRRPRTNFWSEPRAGSRWRVSEGSTVRKRAQLATKASRALPSAQLPGQTHHENLNSSDNKQTHQPLYQLTSGRGLLLLQQTCLAHHTRRILLCVVVNLPTERITRDSKWSRTSQQLLWFISS